MSADLQKTRNIGIAAHIDAGKTTATERILYYAGKIHRMGEVHEGTTTTDFDPEEQARGITIYSAAVTVEWQGHTINVIDTPGHVDFTAEVERSMRVLDGAIAVFDAKEGVEAQSETIWRQANKYNVPRLCFVNKMDKVGADFFNTVKEIRERLLGNPIPVQIPIGAQAEYEGLIDLLTMKAIYFKDDTRGNKWEVREIPEDLLGLAREWRHLLEEKVSETCDVLMDKYIHEQPISPEELVPALRRATVIGQAHPVFCGSALKYVGIQMLLDGVVAYLPSPSDMPPVIGHDPDDPEKEIHRKPVEDEPFCALLFKVVSEKPVDLYFLRIYSGVLKSGTRVYNTNRRKKENISRIFRMFAKRREAIDEARAGDIVAVVGLRDSLTGDTVCDMKHEVVLEKIEFPETVISMAVEPKSSGDRDRLAEALAALSRQDPTFDWRVDPETGQMLIAGMGELHLEIMTHRLDRDMNVAVKVGRPRVSYRETVVGKAKSECRFIRQTGGHGQFAVVELSVEPYQPTEGEDHIVFENDIRGGSISRQYVKAVEDGVREAAKGGVLAGYPLINAKVTLLDGKEHPVDSSDLAFETAGMMAFRQACQDARVGLLEPIMRLEVTVPEEYFGSVNGDLHSRRGSVTDSFIRVDRRVIHAQVPLAEMFGYSTTLRSLTQGRAAWLMEPSHFAAVPVQVAETLLQEA
jgi:elongation factor G